MSFWTWAKSLEDTFDASSRRNLHDFIGHADTTDESEDNEDDEKAFNLAVPSKPPVSDPVRVGVASAGLKVAGSLKRPCVSRADSVETMVDVREQPESFYYMAREKDDGSLEKAPEARRELVRTATCAVFHNTSAAKGVPHSFVGTPTSTLLRRNSLCLFRS